MEEIRTNMSKEDIVHNMLEIAFYLAQWDKDAHEIDVKVKKSEYAFWSVDGWCGIGESKRW